MVEEGGVVVEEEGVVGVGTLKFNLDFLNLFDPAKKSA